MLRLMGVICALILLWCAPAAAGVEELLKQANEGDASAQYELGRTFQEKAYGDSLNFFDPTLEDKVDLDPDPELREMAIYWLESAANKGHFEAKRSLLFEYNRPYLDTFEVLTWYDLAEEMAEEGYKPAQVMLAQSSYTDCYLDGFKNTESLKVAIHWYALLLQGMLPDETIAYSDDEREVTKADIERKLATLRDRIQ